VRRGEPAALAVRELELGLPVAREPEHHHVGGGRGVEERVRRAPITASELPARRTSAARTRSSR
jgi:hypothetical protein